VKHAQWFLEKLKAAEQFIAFLAFCVMALSLFLDVLMRQVIGTGFFGSAQIGVFGMIVASFIGIGLATADGTHLRPRFTDHLIPPKWEGLTRRIGDGITAAFYIFVAVVASSVVRESLELGDVTSTLRVVIWPFQAVIVIAFFFGGLRHILYLVFPELRPLEGGDAVIESTHITPEPKNHAGDGR